MTLDRRELLTLGASGLAVGLTTSVVTAHAREGRRTKAILFDAFPIFDPRPVFTLVRELVPSQGDALTSIWRAKQFEYTWLRATAGQYEDFWKVTEDALVFAARSLNLNLNKTTRERLMGSYLALRPYPDVMPTLESLKRAGMRLGFLSNFTLKMLDTSIKGSGLAGYFDPVLSTDTVRTYKPDPRAYRMGTDALGLKPDEIAFAAFASWDAAGAKWFGYRTVWVNRLKQPAEELSVQPDATCENLTQLAELVS